MGFWEDLFKGKKKEQKSYGGTVSPKIGTVIFLGENHEQAKTLLNPDINRLAIDEFVNKQQVINRVNWYRNNGIEVILCVQDKHVPRKTPELIEYYAKHLGSDKIIYELWNEPNMEYEIALRENWHNLLEPPLLVEIYKDCYTP